ncbi:hypothetical protein ACFL49_00350 [Candidatus Omnitrophota bacterium]
MSQEITKEQAQYRLDEKGCFTIENYAQSKSFSNFFPGIAGLWGIPMWVFYVNRGQCITSFGIESKDKTIMEFQPANKAYRLTSLQGFRTFIKVTIDGQKHYWEPFQNNLIGTQYKKDVRMEMNAHDLTLIETNHDLGCEVIVNYFTMPEEPFSALVRRVKVRNLNKKKVSVEMCDGLPVIVPFGLKDWLIKNISRTVEAWSKVRNVENNAPFYQLNVEVSDEPEVTHIEEGNFFFSYSKGDKKAISTIIEASCLFGQADDFAAPQAFLSDEFVFPKKQETSNRTPCAFGYSTFEISENDEHENISLYGYAHNVDQLNGIVDVVKKDDYISEKALLNESIVKGVRNKAFTKSSSPAFDMYASHTFLDNVLRGGLPVSLKTSEGNVALNVYSRKHGDLERDYNFFFVSPTFYSQGNGNYRDVNQNRRNDIWFNTDVSDSHLVNFLNLSQADGYNPLVVKGTTFVINNQDKLKSLLESSSDKDGATTLAAFLQGDFLLGSLLEVIEQKSINIKGDVKDFVGSIIEISSAQELAEHGEGFWSDHWTYNLDLIEGYLSVYPENLKHLLLEDKKFCFYHNDHYVLPREKRYILTSRGVRQYESIGEDKSLVKAGDKIPRLKIKNGDGEVFYMNLTVKLLTIIANKVASLDPSNIGVEMEAGKPNWYDALNGLPGLIGSSISEAIEVKRFAQFLLEGLKSLSLEDALTMGVFEELETFISGLSHVLSLEEKPLAYWNKANDIKECYRKSVRAGILGNEKLLTIGEIKLFLSYVIAKIEKGIVVAKEKSGFMPTYFYHEVVKHELLDKGKEAATPFVRAIEFKRHDLPLFLEGYVHAFRGLSNKEEAKALYDEVRQSPLFDKALKMYKVNTDLSGESEEIGRTRIFPRGWLENESIWLHMEYKFLLEVLRADLFEEYYDDFKSALVPFLNPQQYGRSILENSSFIVSSAHEDKALHGRGFVARLSGSTAEFLHMWLFMNVGKQPFRVLPEEGLVLSLEPKLPAWLFTKESSMVELVDQNQTSETVEIPENCYAFNFLSDTLVVYHNEKRKNTFSGNAAVISKSVLQYKKDGSTVEVSQAFIAAPYSEDVRSGKISRIDVYFE